MVSDLLERTGNDVEKEQVCFISVTFATETKHQTATDVHINNDPFP